MRLPPEKIEHPAPPGNVIALLTVMLLPFLLGICLFETLTGYVLDSGLARSRDLLPAFARRMEEAGKPATLLSSIISREVHGDFAKDVAGQTIPEFMERLQKAIGVPASLSLFDTAGRLVYPAAGVPDRSEREALYQAVEHHLFRRPITPESQQRDLVARTFARKQYGLVNWRDFSEEQRLVWECRNPPAPPLYIGFIRWRLFENPIPANLVHAYLQVEIKADAIPERMKDEGCLEQLPEEAACAAIVGSGSVLRVKAKGGWMPPERLFLDGKLDEVVPQAGFFLYTKLLDRETGRTLGLAIPMPFPANIPFPLRYFLEALFLGFLAVRGKRLAEVLLGTRRLEIGLGRQIFLSFLFAALVPLLALTFLGGARLIGMKDLQTALWKSRMVGFLTTLDRNFSNWIESLQMRCQEFGRELAARPSMPLARETVPPALAKAHSFAYVDAGSGNFPVRLYSAMGNRATSEFAKNADQMKKVMRDFLRQFLSERGQLPVSTPGAAATPMLTIQDLLGEDNPLLTMVKTMNQLVYSEYSQTRYGSFCRLIETAQGKIRGLMLVIFDITGEGNDFLDREARKLRQERSPFVLFSVQPDNPANHFPGFGRVDVSQYVQGSRETQQPEHFLLSTLAGREYLGTTCFPRYLLGRFPICAVPTAPIDQERDGLIRGILAYFVLGLGTIVLVSRLLWGRIIIPVKALQDGARQITAGRYAHRLAADTTDELGTLSRAFNTMAGWLQERERMKRFVSASLVSDVQRQVPDAGDHSKGRRVEAAILFSDIRGFTTLSESHSADELVQLLNDYFSDMDLVIQRESGEIQKFIGDAIQAVFHQVPGLPHPAIRATNAGVAMRKALHALNLRRQEQNLFTIENGIGIHFDQVVEGKVGALGGRLDFTVMGPALAIAQTLESFSKEGAHSRVILSGQAFRQVSGHFSCVPLTARQDEAWEIESPREQVDHG